MKFSLLKVGLSLLPLLSGVHADDCTTIKSNIKNVKTCTVDNEGRAIELEMEITTTDTKKNNYVIPELDLTHYSALENFSFECFIDLPNYDGIADSEGIKFPDSIKKITITGIKTSGKIINEISLKPNVEFLNITNSQLYVLPETFVNLVNLKELDFSNNSFNWLYPPTLVYNLKNLKALNLSHNKLRNLAPEFENLENLEKLDISDTSLESVPDILYKMKNLKELNLSQNSFSMLPSDFDKLENLEKLDLSLNGFRNIPEVLFNLINLKELIIVQESYLNLRADQYTIGEIPSGISKLQNLEKLDLNNNEIRTLPDELFELSKLEVLKLNDNYIRTIPSQIKKLSNLKELELESNSYSGLDLPIEICELKNLEKINLSSNELTNSNPTQCPGLVNLKELDLFRSDIGSVSPEIGNLTNLEIIDLRYNKLTELPAEIGNLKNLKEIDLRYNKLTELPAEIGNIKNLKEIYLDDNQITKLPKEIENLENLKILNIDGSHFETHDFINSISNIKNLNELYIYDYKFEDLPESLSNLENIKMIKISSSYLETLPKSLSNLKNLKELNISSYLLRRLPESIGDLENLEILDLSGCNNLEALPESLSKIKTLKKLYIDSNSFKAFPKTIFDFENLESLELNGCRNITEIPHEIVNLQKLERLYIVRSGITVIPGFLADLENLKYMYVEDLNTYEVVGPEMYKYYVNYDFCISSKLQNNKINCLYNYAGVYGDCFQRYPLCDEKPVELYIYNANKNKCLSTTGKPGSTLTYGTCDNSDNTIWIVPNSHYGNYRSKANPDYCINVENGKVTLEECSDSTIIYRNVNFIKSPYSINDANYCMGSSKKNPNEISLKECDVNDPDQIWFFNFWDSSVVVEETQPDTMTIYFYNALKNECIQSDGSTVTTGNCFNNENALWEIPSSHFGYYRLKSNSEKCLGIIDGVVIVSDCTDENSILYRDGNFIKSPLSDDQCIVSSNVDNTLEYLEGCDVSDPNHIWYYNIWTPPTEEISEPTISEVSTAPSETTGTSEENQTISEISIPTTTAAATEENPIVTITTTVTSVMTEAY